MWRRFNDTIRLQWNEKLFLSETNVPHVVHRWQDKMLKYKFVIWHQPERMMWECDMLSHYKNATKLWRENDVDNK